MATVTIDVVGKDSFSSVLGNFGNILTGIKSAIDLVGDAFRVFKDLALEGLDAVADYERLSVSLNTLAASQLLMTGEAENMASAMAMTADVAEELLGWTQDLAINSPFTQEGVAEALRMAMAYGFTVEEARRLVQAEIDYVAGSGQTEFAMQRISLALGQISATGKLTGQDMMQLTNVGVPVAQILADAFGVTTAEIIEMRTAGLIPAQDAIEAITSWMETNFQGAAANFAESWAGLKGTFEDLKAMGMREFFGGLFEALQPLAIAFSEWLQTEGMEKLREWGEMLGNFTADLIEKIPVAIAKIEELKTAFETGGLRAVVEIILNDIDEQAVLDWLDEIDTSLAEKIDSYDWAGSGEAFGKSFRKMLDEADWSATIDPELIIPTGEDNPESIKALTDGLNEWFSAAVDGMDKDGTRNKIVLWWEDVTAPMDGHAKGKEEAEAFIDGMNEFEEDATNAFRIWWTNVTKPADIYKPFNDEASANFINGLNEFEVEATNAVREWWGRVTQPMDADGADVDWNSFITGMNEFESDATNAVREWWGRVTQPMEMDGISWDEFVTGMNEFEAEATQAIREWWSRVSRPISGDAIGEGIVDGIVEGMNNIELDITNWVREHIVDPIKRFLGIASPSTVFIGIGQNIVLGLIMGIGSMLAALLTVASTIGSTFVSKIEEKFSTLKEKIATIFAKIKEAWDESGLSGVIGLLSDWFDGSSSSTGSVGSGPGDTTHPRDDGTLTGTVTNTYNFWGPVYMYSVGPEGTYECAPSPLITSGAQGLPSGAL